MMTKIKKVHVLDKVLLVKFKANRYNTLNNRNLHPRSFDFLLLGPSLVQAIAVWGFLSLR